MLKFFYNILKPHIHSRFFTYITLSLLLIMIILPRFNRLDYGFATITGGMDDQFVSDRDVVYKNLSDCRHYLNLVKYFRHPTNDNKSFLTPPFCYRPLPSFLASLLPFDEMTALNIVNVIFLLATIFVLERIISKLSVSSPSKYLSLCLYVCSFPQFYYGTIGYIDPVFIFFIALGLLCIMNKRYLWFVFTTILGTFSKEGIAILIPVAIVAAIRSGQIRAYLGVFGSILGYFIVTLFNRYLFVNTRQYMWIPSIEFTLMNVIRFRFIFSTLMSFGIPGVLSILFCYNAVKSNISANPFVPYFLCGTFFSILFCLYGVVSVYADGRYIWPLCIFSVPLSSLYIDSFIVKFVSPADSLNSTIWFCKNSRTDIQNSLHKN